MVLQTKFAELIRQNQHIHLRLHCDSNQTIPWDDEQMPTNLCDDFRFRDGGIPAVVKDEDVWLR